MLKAKTSKLLLLFLFWHRHFGLIAQVIQGYWLDYYNSFNDDQKNSYYGKFIKQKVSITTGAQFPPFNLPTPEGKKLALKDILSKGKLTIVQVLGLNSYNIETIQSDLVALNNKYHNKGLNVVEVSSDTSANKWKGTIFRQRSSMVLGV